MEHCRQQPRSVYYKVWGFLAKRQTPEMVFDSSPEIIYMYTCIQLYNWFLIVDAHNLQFGVQFKLCIYTFSIGMRYM